jgi:hypothetical protein
MDFKILFIVAAISVGITEYIKKLLPTKWVSNKVFLPIFSGVISACSSVVYGLAINFSIKEHIVAALIILALSQTCYSLLWKTFEALKKYLEKKLEKGIEDEIANKI